MNASRPLPRELDSETIQRAIVDGSRPAFVRLYRHYGGKVRYGVARAAIKVGRSAEVEDLIQEVWCRLMSNDRRLLSYFDPERGHFGPFLSLVAYQQTLYVLQLQRNKSRVDDLPGATESLRDDRATEFVAEVFQRNFFQKLLDRVDAELAVEDQVLLREHYLSGLSLREIAERLGVKEGTIYQRNRRLKRKLAKIVEQLQPPTSPNDTRAAVTALVMAIMIVQQWKDEAGTHRAVEASSSARTLR